MLYFIRVLFFSLMTATIIYCQSEIQTRQLTLNSSENLELINVHSSVVELNGKSGIRVEKKSDLTGNNFETLVLINNSDFLNGTIELEIAGESAPDAPPLSRGFVGLAFRVNKDSIYNYDCFYLRPANGRAEDQLQRNHSVQYVSQPDYPWYRMRKEYPGLYETYVDLVPGEWTKIKIEVSGEKAKLFVHDSVQPTLIVNELKGRGESGQIALWLHSSTIAHYRNLKITYK